MRAPARATIRWSGHHRKRRDHIERQRKLANLALHNNVVPISEPRASHEKKILGFSSIMRVILAQGPC